VGINLSGRQAIRDNVAIGKKIGLHGIFLICRKVMPWAFHESM